MSYFKITDPLNKYYINAIDKEIEIERSQATEIIPNYDECIDLHPIVNKYLNSHILNYEDDTETGWYNYFISNEKTYDFGLSLGTGTGRHQLELINKGFVKKWISIDLVTDKGEFYFLNKESKVEINNDLNFTILPENTYPVIFCHGLLHHIINIEHLLYQVNKSLVNNGLFIVSEYIGENKWQWKKNKIDLINRKVKIKFPHNKNEYTIKRPSLYSMQSRPLESIRSIDLLHCISYYFSKNTILQKTLFPALYPLINSNSPKLRNLLHNDKKQLEKVLDNFIEIDRDIINNNKDIIPCLLLGIYKKTNGILPLETKPWSNVQIKKYLYQKNTFKIKIKNILKKYLYRFGLYNQFLRIFRK